MFRTDTTDSPISELPDWRRDCDRDAYQERIASELASVPDEPGF